VNEILIASMPMTIAFVTIIMMTSRTMHRRKQNQPSKDQIEFFKFYGIARCSNRAVFPGMPVSIERDMPASLRWLPDVLPD